MLIAYNRVRHITILFTALIRRKLIRKEVRIIISVVHGLRASILFYIAGDRYRGQKTRILYIIGGVLLIDRIILIYTVIRNLALPPFIRFTREVYIVGIITRVGM